jgi:ParB-like chromosome segregation protein Spo0J
MTLNIQQRAVTDLIPYIANSRTHSDAQVAQIAASIKEFGWTNPILVSGDDSIIAGHGRLMAARKLGMEEVPVIALRSPKQVTTTRLSYSRQPTRLKRRVEHGYAKGGD